jgi:hypothetical protein
MVDVHERLRDLREAPAPDLWPEVSRRRPGRVRTGSHWSRVAVVGLALLVAASGLAVVLRAFVGAPAEEQPSDEVTEAAPPRLEITASVDVGSPPRSVAVGEGAVWVVAQSPDRPRAEVVRIDPSTNEVVARIPIPHGTGELAVGEGAVWVTTHSKEEGGALVRIDPAVNRIVATVPGAGGSPTVGEGAVWVVAGREPGDGSIPDQIVRIEPDANRIVARIPLPLEPPPFDIEVGDHGVWALHSGKGDEPDLARIDPVTNSVTATASLDTVGIYMAVGGGHVWVAGWPVGVSPDASRYPAALRISEEEASVVGEPIPVDDFRPFAVGEGGVWFTTWRRFGEERVCRLSFETLGVDACVDVPSFGETYADLAALDLSARTIWVLNDGETVSRIDLL